MTGHPIFNARIISYEPVTVMEFDVGENEGRHRRVSEWVRYVPLTEVVRHDVAVAICSEVSGLSPDIRDDVQDVLRALEETFGEPVRMERRADKEDAQTRPCEMCEKAKAEVERLEVVEEALRSLLQKANAQRDAEKLEVDVLRRDLDRITRESVDVTTWQAANEGLDHLRSIAAGALGRTFRGHHE